MNLKRMIAMAAVCGTAAIGIGAVLPAGAQTSSGSAGSSGSSGSAATATGTTPEPPSETTDCQFGQWPDAVNGRPVQLEAGATAGLYLWHDEDGWHAFVTHANHMPVDFRITVRSATRIYGVETHDERGDAVIEHADDHAVTLRARNFGYLDGMNFRTACGRGIDVSGTIDGHPLDAAHVFIGHDGDHPDQFPVVISRS
jgi:hypothetical protein